MNSASVENGATVQALQFDLGSAIQALCDRGKVSSHSESQFPLHGLLGPPLEGFYEHYRAYNVHTHTFIQRSTHRYTYAPDFLAESHS